MSFLNLFFFILWLFLVINATNARMMSTGHSRMRGRRKNSSGNQNDKVNYGKCDCIPGPVTIKDYNDYKELQKTGEEVLTVEKFSCTCIKKDSSEITIADMIIYIICVCFASLILSSVVIMNCVDFYNKYK